MGVGCAIFILTEHGTFNAFLHARGLTDISDYCRRGMGTDDWKHVLTTCSGYNDIRDLDSIGTIHIQVMWDFNRALEDVRAIGVFANDVFRRRSIGRWWRFSPSIYWFLLLPFLCALCPVLLSLLNSFPLVVDVVFNGSPVSNS